jgi:hypothetical protein
MRAKFYRSEDGKAVRKVGGKNSETFGQAQDGTRWVAIRSTEYYWRRSRLTKKKCHLTPSQRIELVVDLARQGEEAVHAYCMERFGHGSRTPSLPSPKCAQVRGEFGGGDPSTALRSAQGGEG